MSGVKMKEYKDDIEVLTRMERKFGPLSKTLAGGYSMSKMDTVKSEFVSILQKYKTELGIRNPIPHIRMWAEEDKVNFLFFDKNTGKRILLGEWLEGKDFPYEQ
jgi:hypothetical protein